MTKSEPEEGGNQKEEEIRFFDHNMRGWEWKKWEKDNLWEHLCGS
jgi:hypothetical protein